MLNSLNSDSTLEKHSNQLGDKEKLRSNLFNSEYRPDFDFSLFFKNIEKYIKKNSFLPFNQRSLKFLKTNKEEYIEVINLVKNNNYKIDIKFLETLENKKKYLISSIFINSIGIDKLSKEFHMGKSLFIWMSFWYNYRGNNLIDNEGFEELICKIRDNFPTFDSIKFIQAYRFIKYNNKIEDLNKYFYDVLAEYNLIKNIDNDIDKINKKKNSLGKDFSFGTFHTKSELGFGNEIKYGNYGLDKDGNETNIHKEGDRIMLNKNGEEVLGAYTLDRNHYSINKDASGIEYHEYIDSPTGIALFHKNKPVACICFYIRNGTELFINQIQKIVHYEYDRYGRCIGKHYSDIVKDIDWENILYEVAKELTNNYNISKIVIQGGENNKRINEVWKDLETPYFKYNCENIRTIPANKGKKHLSVDIAKKIYDVFALKKGFQYDKEGNLEKDLDDLD